MSDERPRLVNVLAAAAGWGTVAGLAVCAVEFFLSIWHEELAVSLILGPAWPWLVLVYAAFGLVAGLVIALVLWALRRPLGIERALASPHGAFPRLFLVGAPIYILFVVANDDWLHPAMNRMVLVWDVVFLLAVGLAITVWFRLQAGAASRLTRFALLLPAALAVLSTGVPLIAGEIAEEAPPEMASRPERPFNVLVVTVDTLRAKQLGCYGYPRPTSPVIDRLAREGVRLADARTVSTQTDTSHATMFTGLYPTNHGLLRNGWNLQEENTTLAEMLRGAGYETFSAISVQHLSSFFGFMQGVQTYHDTSIYDRFYIYSRSNHSSFSIPVLSRSDLIKVAFGSPLVPTFRTAEHATDDFLGWFGDYDGKAPFYAWVHVFDPHSPYEPPEGWAERFQGLPPALDKEFQWDEGAKRRFDNYDGEVAFVDSQLGRIVDAIDARGLTDRTLIVILADHGESLGERGARGHNGKSYEEVLQVPWIMRLPGHIPEGAVLDVPASTVDLAPTILAVLGLEPPGDFDGLPLPLPVPELRDVVLPPRPILARTETWRDQLHLAVVEGDAKSLETRSVSTGKMKWGPELFNLKEDPLELHDLSDKKTRQLAALRRELSPMLVSVAGQGPVDEETNSVLRALGYVQ